MNPSVLRIAPWIVLIAVAYALGRWHATPRADVDPAAAAASSSAPAPVAEVTDAPPPAPEPAVSAAEQLLADLGALHESARYMPAPDSRTYAFFEHLTADDMPAVADYIRRMPAGNEQDLFFTMAIRRWAQLDGATAVAQAATFPALTLRINAQLAAWETWGSQEPAAALELAGRIADETMRPRALSALLAGASTRDPRTALTLWKSTPDSFRESDLGAATLEQIVAGAYGTGKREAIKTLVAEETDTNLRNRLAASLAREWGGHYPDDTLLWLTDTIPDEPERQNVINGLFTSLVRKDPPLAALWGIEFPDEARRPGFISAAIAEWVNLNPAEAELWINEQDPGRQLDGATWVMASHYIEHADMPRAFAWIRRITQSEARGRLLGELGRAWSTQKPDEFQKFIEDTSLNRSEVEMLLSKLGPAT